MRTKTRERKKARCNCGCNADIKKGLSYYRDGLYYKSRSHYRNMKIKKKLEKTHA